MEGDTSRNCSMDAHAAGAPPSPRSGIRRRTPKQLDRKRTLDKAAQKVRREKEKAWKNQVQSDLRNMQQQMDSLREGMNRMLGSALVPNSGVVMDRSSTFLPRFATLAPTQNTLSGNTASDQNSHQPTSWSRAKAGGPMTLHKATSTNLNSGSNLSTPYQPGMHMSAVFPLKALNSDSPSVYAAPILHHGLSLLNPSSNHGGSSGSTAFACGLTPASDTSIDVASPVGTSSQISSDPPTSLLIEEGHEPPVGCLCNPTEHSSYAECFEQSVFDALIKIHRHHNMDATARVIPRSPALVDMLFIGKGDNVVTQVVDKMLRRTGFRTLAFLFSAYILVYRVLRYRFFPSLDTLQDVPEWLRSDDVQSSTPHLIFTDFVHFPKLRTAMVLGSVSYVREEFDYDYARHISLSWPNNKSLLVRSDRGDMILNPDFEPHIFNLDNWSLDSAFARKYPQMAPLVTIRD